MEEIKPFLGLCQPWLPYSMANDLAISICLPYPWAVTLGFICSSSNYEAPAVYTFQVQMCDFGGQAALSDSRGPASCVKHH